MTITTARKGTPKKTPRLSQELFDRATRAYRARCTRAGTTVLQPCPISTTIEAGGVIVMRNRNGELARFRLRNDRLVYVEAVAS